KDLVTLLKNPGAGIILGGYTDSRGSAVYNLGLSLRRATAVKQYLVEHGVKPEQIVIYAYGKELAKQGTSENVWQNDRRVDVIIYEDKQ
ncbi:MAG TPA: OmpA family protein, partial [Verrucomicrobiae bacterium]